jgi:hypothetical protein
MGPAGSGKTTALATLAKAGLETFVLVTEPTGVDSLLDAWDRLALPIDRLHYHVVAPASPGWSALEDIGVRANAMSYKDLSELKSGVGKEKMRQWPALIRSMKDFHDQRSGLAFGDVTSWGPDRALCVDSLTGLNLICMQNTVGFKPSPHQGEWGIAMSLVENLLLTLSSDLHCFFILTAHIEKEPDEITGLSRITVSTLGRKLAPKIPRFFSEVVRARKDATGRYLWATQDGEADLKNRALPSAASLPADFGPIVDAYKRRTKLIQPPAAAE